VGYEETIDFTKYPGARAFTIALLVFGVGSFLSFISNLTAVLVEGTLDHLWVRRKMEKEIAKLSQHEIGCGVGGTGVHVVRELLDTGRPFVLVEADVERLDQVRAEIGDFPAVVGDATSDDVLLAAGIERAEGLVTCVSNDRTTSSSRSRRGCSTRGCGSSPARSTRAWNRRCAGRVRTTSCHRTRSAACGWWRRW
jgi:voltage-gated potassium channel